MFAVAASLLFNGAPGVSARSATPVLWLGAPTKSTEANFVKRGVPIQAVDCAAGDTACVSAEIDAAAARGPRVLVAPGAYTVTVVELYDRGLSKEQVRGVVLLDPAADEISIPAVSAGASPLLVLIEQTAEEDAILAASTFTRTMEKQGVAATLRFVEAGMLNPEAIHAGIVLNIYHFMGGDPGVEHLRLLFDAEFAWPELPPNNRKLRALKEFLSTRPMNDAVRRMLAFHYRFSPHNIHRWPLQTYDSFDLLAYRDRVSPGARYLILRNRLGMIFVLDLDVYGAYEPEVVVGIDDEPNMYRMNWFFRTNLMYSWRSEKPKLSSRPLGPFLSFRKPVPDELIPPVFPVLTVHLDGIEFSDENPLAAMSAYPETVQRVITKDNRCIYCHEIEGMGGRAYHLDAMTAHPQGGYALPLAYYSEEVMRQFVFDQEAAAAKIGVVPNAVDAEVASEFFAWTRTLTPSHSQSE